MPSSGGSHLPSLDLYCAVSPVGEMGEVSSVGTKKKPAKKKAAAKPKKK